MQKKRGANAEREKGGQRGNRNEGHKSRTIKERIRGGEMKDSHYLLLIKAPMREEGNGEGGGREKWAVRGQIEVTHTHTRTHTHTHTQTPLKKDTHSHTDTKIPENVYTHKKHRRTQSNNTYTHSKTNTHKLQFCGGQHTETLLN